MHGEFPFPEATATTEVLVAGEAGGKQAKILMKALVIGGIYDFMVWGLYSWLTGKDNVSVRGKIFCRDYQGIGSGIDFIQVEYFRG